MTAGIPGTGIGGLYYVLLALWMPFREIGLTLRGRGDRARWRRIARQSFMACGILAVLWGEAWLLKRPLMWVAGNTPPGSWWHKMTVAASPSVIPVAVTWVGLGLLGGVILTTHILRLWVRYALAQDDRRSRDSRPFHPQASLERRDGGFPPATVGVAGIDWRRGSARDQVPIERTRESTVC